MKDCLVNIRADVLKLAKCNIYEKHQMYIGDFDKKWRCDTKIIPIMCAITLFTPDRSRTVHSDVIKLEQVELINFCQYFDLDILLNIYSDHYRHHTTVYYDDIWKAFIQDVKQNKHF